VYYFRDLEDMIFNQIDQYNKVAGEKVSGDLHGDFILKAPLPIIRIPRRIITIQPPYDAENVLVHSKVFRPLARQLRKELALFWNFGKVYQYQDEERKKNDYELGIYRKRLADAGLLKPRRELVDIATERETKRFQAFLSSMN